MAAGVGLEKRYVQIGQVLFDAEPSAYQAVLGPAVVVCVWDRKRRVGGMTHFGFPEPADGERRTTRFGSIAIPRLIALMIEGGSQRRDLVAKAFGGAHRGSRLTARKSIGYKNAAMAVEALRREGIPLVAEDLGGASGRRLVYLTHLNRVKLLRTMDIRDSDWRLEERD